MFKLRWYQEGAINAALANVGKVKSQLLCLPTGCHAKGHGILMYDGTIRRVEDVMIGDLVMGADSTPREVIHLIRGRQEMRRIVPNKAEPFVVNLDHKLPVALS